MRTATIQRRPFRSDRCHPLVAIAVACSWTLLAGATPVLAQTGTISVLVHDAATAAPLSGVRVTIDHHPAGDTTDATGLARFVEVPEGAHLVGLRLLGYAPDSQSIQVAAGQNTIVERALHSSATPLPRVTTKATTIDPRLEGFMRRRAKGGGYFFTSGQIDSSNTRTLDQLLRADTPARLVPGPAGQAWLASHSARLDGLRVDKPCWVQVFWDGVLIFNPLEQDLKRDPPPDLRDYKSYNLEAIEFYPDPATTPAQFREGAPSCGTLVLWSRMH
jgi:Carboxypeptidase regulatory-like domain